jgi:Divergent InlB B-repeat domain
VNNSPVGNEDTQPPFSINWDTNGLLPNSYELRALARDAAGNESLSAIITVTISGTTGTPEVAWQATQQNTGGKWNNSGWDNRSFRVLLEGDTITRSGSTVQLTLRGRSSGSYTIHRLSLVRRDGTSLNGVDSSFSHITFGGSWNAGVTVPAGGTVTSDPLPFDLVAGQDLFLTYWVPAGQPTLYYSGNAQTTSWVIGGSDTSATIDWSGLTISDTNTHLYSAERLDVLPTTAPPAHPLTVTVTGNGTITSHDARLSCPGSCTQAYPQGTTVTLTAQPTSGSTFQGWSGTGCSGTGSCLVTLAQATTITATFSTPTTPEIAWQATQQNAGGKWNNSGWDNRSFRVLLDGDAITRSGSTVQLTLRGRSSGSYTIHRVSLVRRDGTFLNGVDSSFSHITFGGSWNAGVTVPAGATVTSDPLPFDLVAGQDLFLTYWVPAGQPTLYYSGNAQTTSWVIGGSDTSATIDWSGLTISDTNNHLYSAERLEVLP